MTETDSTNNYLSRYAMSGTDYVVAVADYQTAGRGQAGNRWESERGKNLLYSILACPLSVAVSRQFILSMAHGLALKEALGRYISGVTLKWPNDIYWQDCKLGGTLIEVSVGDGRLKRCVFGTGINVNQQVFRSDAPNPVSLLQIIGDETDRKRLLEDILLAFEHNYMMVEQGRYDEIIERYHHALYRCKGFYPYRDKDGEFDAEIVKVAPDGRITLRERTGKERVYAFKEVAFVLNHDATKQETINNNDKNN